METFFKNHSVNCWKAKYFNIYANQQLRSMNVIFVVDKVQRLENGIDE